MNKQILRRILILLTMLSLVGINSFAEEKDMEKDVSNANDLQYEKEADSWRYKDGYLIDDESGNSIRSRAAFIPWSEVNGSFINSRGEIIEGAVRKGIDVSEFQGNIDWAKVKASGIDFAIIRCGYGGNYTNQDDAKWQRNVSECERLGIPYGVYLYSYANSTAKAQSEAQHVLRLLKGHTPSYPVYYDLEDKIVSNAGKTAIVNYANIFCSTIEANGYRAGIYANLNWWNNILNSSSLNKYEKWVAQWNYKCTYSGDYRLWQCTSDGSVPGINGRVDLNFEFWKQDTVMDVDDYTVVLTAEYKNYRKGPSTSYDIVGKIDQGDEVTVTHRAEDWGKLENGSWMNLSGTSRIEDIADYTIVAYDEYKNYRKGPGTSCELVGKIDQGEEIEVTHKAGDWGKLGNGSWMNLWGTLRIEDVDDYTVVLNDEYKYLRKGPNTNCDIAREIKKGDKVKVTHEAGDWGKLENGLWMNLANTSRI